MRASIKETVEKIKHFYTSLSIEVIFAILVMLVGFGSFGLGRISAMQEVQDKIILTYNTEIQSSSIEAIAGAVVASVRGEKYHYPWCSGARRISERNKVWYKSIEEAQRAGKTPAKNCKGLK